MIFQYISNSKSLRILNRAIHSSVKWTLPPPHGVAQIRFVSHGAGERRGRRRSCGGNSFLRNVREPPAGGRVVRAQELPFRCAFPGESGPFEPIVTGAVLSKTFSQQNPASVYT